ncbi:MAG: hypothetical protein IPI38_10745 [Gemmatimonadetes bacterium]|nr:hypothetical protein [Gemmatimonadota bacterium]MBP9200317.1 hypothetical protein [Gemmatimonadales bacterium]MBK7349628.1 hypothetical protein [Gemmatimonadota bacterium]MBK7715887.1 hypothetical protein [Gemmatimonadota bacterium]MBK7784258.1 hypothetical protein [Gemmatimonadota bacterium]
MLTALQLQQQRRRRALPSLKQQYHEYILQRIEGYKNSLSRRELLELGDAAAGEMAAADGAQFLLTEVLLTDWVDRLIYRRLRLQPYNRWARHFRQLREAQREPTHWGVDPGCPVKAILPRLEPGDTALIIGNDAAPLAFLLAAFDVEVVFSGSDMTFVDQVESRVAEEALGYYCSTYVAPTGQIPHFMPERIQVVAIDTATLEAEPSGRRRVVLERLMARTAPCGVHLILPSEHALKPEALLSHYGEWVREDAPSEKRRAARSAGLLLSKPPEVTDPPAAAHQSRGVSA